MRKAFYPGTFDPITLGHREVALVGLEIFDQILIGICADSKKPCLFSAKERLNFIEKEFEAYTSVSANIYTGLTVQYAKSQGASYLLRGLRSCTDYEYEAKLAADRKSVV